MEKAINDFSLGLFLWQTFVILLLITIVYYVVKLYKKIIKYLESKK